jgi:hypothetical protein
VNALRTHRYTHIVGTLSTNLAGQPRTIGGHLSLIVSAITGKNWCRKEDSNP